MSSLILRAKAIRQRIAAFREGVVPGQHLQEASEAAHKHLIPGDGIGLLPAVETGVGIKLSSGSS